MAAVSGQRNLYSCVCEGSCDCDCDCCFVIHLLRRTTQQLLLAESKSSRSLVSMYSYVGAHVGAANTEQKQMQLQDASCSVWVSRYRSYRGK